MGLWLEVLHGRMWTLSSNPCRRKELWRKNLSDLVAMWLGPILLLVQAYLLEIILMSSRSQSYIRSSTHSLAGSRTMLPPLLSAHKRVRLRSLEMMVFSRLTRSAWFLMDSQQAFFFPAFTGTYTFKRLKSLLSLRASILRTTSEYWGSQKWLRICCVRESAQPTRSPSSWDCFRVTFILEFLTNLKEDGVLQFGLLDEEYVRSFCPY